MRGDNCDNNENGDNGEKDIVADARLPRFSLDRRITVLVLLATTVVVGIVAASSIPLELIPRGYSDPFLSIFVPWRDAPPREVLEKITNPLEDELSTVKGVDRITSVSFVGVSRLFMRFKQGSDMDIAYREVRDRIERARREFPDDVDKVYTFKDDASGIPVFVLGAAIDSSLTDYYNLIQKQIVLPIERVDGVASVEVNGLEEKEILIELDRDRTSASGLNIYELAQELSGDNFSMASGFVRDSDKKLLLRSVARYSSIEEIQNLLVAPNVRLSDIATIRYEEPDKRYRVRAMSKPAYAIIVFKEGEANTREVAERVREVLDSYKDNPRLSGVEVISLFDQGQVIDESLSTLLKSGAIGGILAAFVLFFFLRRFRVMMVVNLAVPLSLVIAMTVMFFAGETLNLLSLLALMVCVGLLVDNSVVVAENIDRLHKAGRTRRKAAISGAGEIALAITMSTLTTVIVFLPVSLVEGPAQFFLLRMAIPICLALLASLLVAVVLIPLGVYLTLPKRIEEEGADHVLHTVVHENR
jgi:HAE1 family hydrophobic/amphiphilic exporter-1